MQRLKIRKLHPNAVLPTRKSSGSAGFDLSACIEDSVIVPPLGRCLIPTGIALALPSGYEGQVRPRSGLAWNHGITVVNAPGTIDEDYRGEIKAALINLSDTPFTISPRMRIAQLIVSAIAAVEIVEVDHLDPTERGSGGFGHTGLGTEGSEAARAV